MKMDDTFNLIIWPANDQIEIPNDKIDYERYNSYFEKFSPLINSQL